MLLLLVIPTEASDTQTALPACLTLSNRVIDTRSPIVQIMAASLPQRTLGKGTAAINGSAVAFGAMSLYGMPGAPDEEASMKVIRHSLSCGINIINTSDLYGNVIRLEMARL